MEEDTLALPPLQWKAKPLSPPAEEEEEEEDEVVLPGTVNDIMGFSEIAATAEEAEPTPSDEYPAIEASTNEAMETEGDEVSQHEATAAALETLITNGPSHLGVSEGEQDPAVAKLDAFKLGVLLHSQPTGIISAYLRLYWPDDDDWYEAQVRDSPLNIMHTETRRKNFGQRPSKIN
jgi:hypothetical protein